MNWRDLFDIVIVSAQKPDFFDPAVVSTLYEVKKLFTTVCLTGKALNSKMIGRLF